MQTDTKNKVEKNKKERASGGLLLGLRKEIEEIKEERRMKAEEGRIECKIRIGEERWRIIGIYVNNDIDRKMESLKDRMEEGEKGVRIMIEDFNARTGEKGGVEENGEEMEGRGRRQENKQRGEKAIRVYRGKRVDDITWKRERRRGKRVYIYSREGETVIG